MTTYKAGQVLTADDLNQSVRGAAQARASGALTVTTTVADAPGATITVTTTEANAVAFVTGVFDVSNAGNDVFVGALVVDGATQSGQAIASGADRKTVSQTWIVTLATAGSHTLKLQANKAGSTASVTLNSTHTTITALVPGI